jgi:uncharacterized protein with beta-barrel porin domain
VKASTASPVDEQQPSGSSAADGVPLSEDAAVADLSLVWRLSPGMTLSARYSGRIGGGSVDNGLNGSLAIWF